MVAVYSNRDATYWVLIITPFVLGALLVGFRNYRKHKKARDEWLKDDITRHRE